MHLRFDTSPWTSVTADWLIVALPESLESAGQVAALNDALGGQIVRLREAQDFTGKLAETVSIPAPSGISAKRLLLVGLGPAEKLGDASLYKAGVTAARSVSTKKTDRVAI